MTRTYLLTYLDSEHTLRRIKRLWSFKVRKEKIVSWCGKKWHLVSRIHNSEIPNLQKNFTQSDRDFLLLLFSSKQMKHSDLIQFVKIRHSEFEIRKTIWWAAQWLSYLRRQSWAKRQKQGNSMPFWDPETLQVSLYLKRDCFRARGVAASTAKLDRWLAVAG